MMHYNNDIHGLTIFIWIGYIQQLLEMDQCHDVLIIYLNSDSQGCSSVLLKLETPILPLKCMRMHRQTDL